MHYAIGLSPLTLDVIQDLLAKNTELALSDAATARIKKCRDYLDRKLQDNSELIYGINTGFGSLCNVAISPAEIEQLQTNLVLSHAAGMGDLTPPEIVRIMLLLKIQSLSYGHSGVRVEVVQRLIDFYNSRVYPVVFELGSLGASGDLAPLAHLSLPLMGKGEVWYEGRRQEASVVLALKNWEPLVFKAKEALALLNGTQFCAAYGVWNLLMARKLVAWADRNAAISYDGFNCRLSPLDKRLHEIRPHAGQLESAAAILSMLDGSAIAQSEKTSVQDPYAFRCAPQVHGASRDAIRHITQAIEVEINAVTDNPNVFPEDDLVISGGNFHAQALALPLDYLCLALSELGNISERRIYQLISGQRGLPPFLTENPGLHSGLMIAQYTAAAIVNQSKVWCTPASSDSIVSCNGQEDHVSMGANAATKARKVALNTERLLSIEFMTAMQALEFRRPARSSETIEALHKAYRQVVPKLESDRILSVDMEKTLEFLNA